MRNEYYLDASSTAIFYCRCAFFGIIDYYAAIFAPSLRNMEGVRIYSEHRKKDEKYKYYFLLYRLFLLCS